MGNKNTKKANETESTLIIKSNSDINWFYLGNDVWKLIADQIESFTDWMRLRRCCKKFWTLLTFQNAWKKWNHEWHDPSFIKPTSFIEWKNDLRFCFRGKNGIFKNIGPSYSLMKRFWFMENSIVFYDGKTITMTNKATNKILFEYDTMGPSMHYRFIVFTHFMIIVYDHQVLQIDEHGNVDKKKFDNKLFPSSAIYEKEYFCSYDDDEPFIQYFYEQEDKTIVLKEFICTFKSVGNILQIIDDFVLYVDNEIYVYIYNLVTKKTLITQIRITEDKRAITFPKFYKNNNLLYVVENVNCLKLFVFRVNKEVEFLYSIILVDDSDVYNINEIIFRPAFWIIAKESHDYITIWTFDPSNNKLKQILGLVKTQRAHKSLKQTLFGFKIDNEYTFK